MCGLSFWINEMEPYQNGFVVSSPSIPPISAVRFVRHMDIPAQDTIYVGMANEVFAALQSGVDLRAVTFFASGMKKGLLELARDCGANLVTAELDILDIHDRLSNLMRKYQCWSQSLFEAAEKNKNIHDIVNTATEISELPMLLLNSNYRLVYSNKGKMSNISESDEIIAKGCLSIESAHLLLGEDWDKKECAPHFVCRRLHNGNICWAMKVFKDNRLISIMLSSGPLQQENFDMETLMELVKTSISRIMTFEEMGYWTGTDFKTLLDDLVEQRLTNEIAINRRFALLSRTPKRFCNIIIIEFESPTGLPNPPTSIFTQLEEIFPDSNATAYKNSIVILLSQPGRAFQPTPVFDTEKFSAILCHYEAFASISNATSHRAMFHSNYMMAKSILQLGKALRSKPSQRFFFFEDYAEYFMIDLCINSFRELLGHDDIIYLTHPEAIKLERYDKKHNTNLLDVLYYYCLNNCNVAQTAKATYMHRNTVSNRIAKINELIHADLSNGQIQHRMMFSYKILRYCSNYAKIDLNKHLNVAEESI